MKDLKQLVNNFKPAAVNSQIQNEVVIDQFAKNIINQVFSQLSIIFPAWKHNWKSDDPSNPDKILNLAKIEWTKAFNENNINTLEQIKYGFAKARKIESDFLPSCGKFISWCTPSPEDMGWPSENEALSKCIEHRSQSKLFGNKAKYCRPMIIELCKRVDWWFMSNVSNQNERKKADEHFGQVYSSLLNSGYTEPQETSHDKLPTQETVNAGLSDQQIEDKKNRGLDHIKNIKAKMRKAKASKLTN